MSNNQSLKDTLFNAYLDLSDGPISTVKTLAFAKLVLWTMFLENKALTVNEIASSAANLLGLASISEQEVGASLEFLAVRKFVEPKDSKFVISKAKAAELSEAYKQAPEIAKKLLSAHFIRSVDEQVLLTWFNEVNESYFSRRADKLFELYLQKKTLAYKLDEVIIEVIEKHGLGENKAELIQGYKEFLLSDDPETQKFIFHLIGAALSAKIVSANVSPEFLNVERYRGATVILDTNVLVKEALRKNDGLGQTFKALGEAFKLLDIKLFATPFTKEEYEKVFNKYRQIISDIIESPKKYLENAAKDNEFLATALEMECSTPEHVDLLFTEALKFPEYIGVTPVKIIDDSELNGIEYNEQQDAKLFNKISDAILKFRTKKKNDNATIHDLLLYKLVEKKKREGVKTFVLTCDSSMETLALEDVSEKEEPNWIKLQSLVQILAVNGAGPDYQPAILAPLVKAFIEIEELDSVESYAPQDIQAFVQITNRIEEIPETIATQLLNKIHRARLSHSNETAMFDVKREIERHLIQTTAELSDTVKEKNELINEKDKTITELSSTIKGTRTWVIKRNQWLWFILKSVCLIAISYLIFIYLGTQLLDAAQVKKDHFLVFQIIVAIGGPIWMITKLYSSMQAKIKNEISQL